MNPSFVAASLLQVLFKTTLFPLLLSIAMSSTAPSFAVASECLESTRSLSFPDGSAVTGMGPPPGHRANELRYSLA